MTGRPLGNAYESKIASMGGDDFVFGRIEDGATITAVAKEIGCSRGWLSGWWMKGPGRKERLKEAKRAAAVLIHEDAGEIPEQLKNLDKADLTPARVAVAKLEYEHVMGRLRAYDPDTYGEKQATVNVLNVGELHLDALRKFGSMALAPKPETLIGTPVDEGDEAA